MANVENKNVGCQHYKRNCRLLAPCCNKVYPCRVCHDDEQMHVLDRKAVEKVVCNNCDLINDIRASCEMCETVFGSHYFCPICRLYDNVDKKQFHCDGCGICRAGGRDRFEHCYVCEMCMPIGAPHKCIEKSSSANCPVCFESIHSSRVQTHIPKCGHLIHSPCFTEMMKKGLYSCPTCGRAMGDMSSVWHVLDREVEMTPMPTEYQDLYREILCKDCSKSSTTKFHIVGMKCGECGSYNTSIEGPFVKKNEDGSFVALEESELENLFHVALPVLEPRADENDQEDQREDEISNFGDAEVIHLEDIIDFDEEESLEGDIEGAIEGDHDGSDWETEEETENQE